VKVVVLGSGRVGARVAEVLSRSNDVTVIDRVASSFDRLGPDFAGETVIGNGIDIDLLRSAGVPAADYFLALTEDDDRNLMAAQIARQLGAAEVIARVYDPVRSHIFAAMGLKTVSPSVSGAQRLFQLVVGEEET
jgi:trk system potassium uptake protein TrkA